MGYIAECGESVPSARAATHRRLDANPVDLTGAEGGRERSSCRSICAVGRRGGGDEGGGGGISQDRTQQWKE